MLPRSWATAGALAAVAVVFVILAVVWETGSNTHPKRAIVAFIVAGLCLVGLVLSRPRAAT